MKKFLSLLMVLVMVLALVPAITSAAIVADDIVILYANDIHGQISSVSTTAAPPVQTNMGYANVAAYKKAVKAITPNVALVDVGDHAQGATIAALTRGEAVIKAMNAAGYDLSTVGNHEFDYGMTGLENLVGWADFDYVSCNFVKLSDNKPVFDPYKIMTFGTKKVAFVGITTPEALTKASPAIFRDASGKAIYGFNQGGNGADLAAIVQSTVNAAKTAGADYVVALGHLGVDESSKPWRSTDVIAATTGIDAFLDGHSHSVVASQIVKNKDGKDVVLSQTGTKLANLGQLVITADGKFSTTLIAASELTAQDATVKGIVDGIEAEFKGFLSQKVATTDFDLTVNFPGTTNRAVRMAETNLGSLCADAYRSLLKSDIAVVNGGGVRANIAKGDITYNDIINVHPFGNTATLIEVSGQTIIDALEMSVSNLPAGENGGFLQVSGITFDVWTDIPTPVVKDPPGSATGTFVKVDGERRVKNVLVDGKPIDLKKNYTVAGHNFMLLDGGDGFSMFVGSKVLDENVMADYEVLIAYIKSMKDGKIDAAYSNPAGLGRIKIDALDYSTLIAGVAAAKALTFAVSTNGNDVADGGKWMTAAQKTALDKAIGAAGDAIAARNAKDQAAIAALLKAVTDAAGALVTKEVDRAGLTSAIAAAEAFFASEEGGKMSADLRAKWFATIAMAKGVFADPNTTKNQVDAAIVALGRLNKTGETLTIFVMAGVALLAMVGLAVTVRRRRFN